MKIFAEVFYTLVIRIFHGASILFSLIWTKFLNFLNDFHLYFLTFTVIIISYWFYLTRSLDLYTLIIAFWLWSVIFVSYKKYIPRLRFTCRHLYAYICIHLYEYICMHLYEDVIVWRCHLYDVLCMKMSYICIYVYTCMYID